MRAQKRKKRSCERRINEFLETATESDQERKRPKECIFCATVFTLLEQCFCFFNGTCQLSTHKLNEIILCLPMLLPIYEFKK